MTNTTDAPKTRVATGHSIDPACPATVSHGFLRSVTHHHCTCPCEAQQKAQDYRERQKEEARVRYQRSRSADRRGARLVVDEAHEALYPPVPGPGHTRGHLDDVVYDHPDIACRGMDLNLFFPVGDSGPAAAQTAEAKAVCRSCPIEDECASAAIRRGEEHGIFGGLTAGERDDITRRMPNGRAA